MEYGYFDSEVTGFDDSTGLPIFDRAQDAEFIADMFASIWGSGVYPNPSDNLQVMERDDSQFGVKVMPGKLWIQGRFGKEIEVSNFAFDAASSTAPRIDIIVAELNKPDREISLKYVKGTPAATPVPPDLVRTSDIYQICLAQCTVRRNATNINQSDILDTRPNTGLCGYVSGVIEQVDTQTLFNQYLAKIEELNSLMEKLGLNPPEGVMYQHVYDPDKTGSVNDSRMLGGQLPEYYAKAADLLPPTAKQINSYPTDISGQGATYAWDDGKSIHITFFVLFTPGGDGIPSGGKIANFQGIVPLPGRNVPMPCLVGKANNTWLAGFAEASTAGEIGVVSADQSLFNRALGYITYPKKF